MDEKECDSSPCVAGHVERCIDYPDIPGRYVCICKLTTSGKNCETIEDICVSDPCSNGASCVLDYGVIPVKFVCDCLPGFRGVSCEVDINECYSNPCQSGST